MKKWFIADTHFSHANVIPYANRPFTSVEEMDRVLIENWNQCIDSDDMVFFLGDFGFGNIDKLSMIGKELKGHKICIRGNHDGSVAKMHSVGFHVVLEAAQLKIGRHVVELVHHPSAPPPSHLQFHGHVHEKRPAKLISNQLNLCVEVWDYKPVSEKTVLSILDKNHAKEKI